MVVDADAAIAPDRLQPGALIPTVSELGTRFGVARSTAQRAVTLLGSEGLCVQSGYRWAYVSASDPLPE
jgi:DNA-binding GntR family transcriptional regulator